MKNYFESQRVIKSRSRKVLISISLDSIIQMLNLPILEGENLIPLNTYNAITLIDQMSLESKANQFSRFLILEKSTKTPFLYSIMVFKEQL